MTQYQWIGLALAICVTLALELAARQIARVHWNGPDGVFWREASGLGILLVVGTVFSLAFPLPPLLTLWVLSGSVGVMLLVLGQANVLQYEPWQALTEKGNLKQPKLRLLEDAMTLGDEESELLRKLERQRLMQKYIHMALRYDGEPRSRGDWEKMVDEGLRE